MIKHPLPQPPSSSFRNLSSSRLLSSSLRPLSSSALPKRHGDGEAADNDDGQVVMVIVIVMG